MLSGVTCIFNHVTGAVEIRPQILYTSYVILGKEKMYTLTESKTFNRIEFESVSTSYQKCADIKFVFLVVFQRGVGGRVALETPRHH